MTLAQGVMYWNAFYPGTVCLPTPSAYPASIEGVECVAIVVRHVRPIVVTDFANDFVIDRRKKERHLRLKRAIPWKPKNTISMEFQARGNSETQHAMWSKDHFYRVYRREFFTEITAGVECSGPDDPLADDPEFFHKIVNRLLELYRAATIDHSAIAYENLRRNQPTVRGAYVAYDDEQLSQPPSKRLVSRIPETFPILKKFSFLEFAENAVVVESDPSNVAVRVGHHFRAGTKVSEVQNALLDCFAHLKQAGNFRFAVIDAFSVAEVQAFDLTAQACAADSDLNSRYQRQMKRKDRVSIKDIINSYLPGILQEHMVRWPSLIGDLDKARKLRHAVVHERHQAGPEDAEFVLNTAQQLVFAAEEWKHSASAT